MGVGKSSNRGSSRSSSEAEDDSSTDGGDSASSDAESNDGKNLNVWQRISTCFQPRGEESQFQSSGDLKVSAKPKTQIPLKALTIENKNKNIDDFFELDREHKIGEGGYASVVPGKDKKTGAKYAVKIIAKNMVAQRSRLQNEIDLMLSLDHPNIVKLFQTFEDQRLIYLVLELCAGGELFDKVIEEGFLSERLTADIMQQIFRAVHYMHNVAHICHRDLKPENFMFHTQTGLEGNTLKVIDFGIAALFKPGPSTFTTKTGTPYYVAPEVLGRWPTYGAQVDMWSCGVIMYVLLSGRLPFKGSDEAATLQKVSTGKFVFPPEAFGKVSKEAKELIRRLLTKTPDDRWTAEQALNDVWTKKVGPSPGSAPLQANVINSIREFNNQNKMKRTALRLVARQLNEGAISNLRKIFTQLDKDGNGTLTVEELSQGLRAANLPADIISSIISGVDSDGSGEIDYSEFIAATLERREYLTESACWSAFRVFDRDGDGKITQKELSEVLTNYQLVQELGAQNVEAKVLMAEVDTNNDGVIDFAEFMQMMRR